MLKEKSYKTLEFHKILQLLADEASSQPGREVCLALLPESDPEEVRHRLDETDDALREILRNGTLPLSGFDDLRDLCRQVEAGSVPGPAAFLRVSRQLRLVARIKSRLSETGRAEEPEESLCMDRIRALYPLHSLEERIDECILNEEELKDRASPELYRLRRNILNLQEEVKIQLDRIVRKSGAALQDQLVTLRSDRYVIPVKAEHRGAVQGIVHDSSSSGATVFVEPMVVVELNNKIREAKVAEQEEIERILAELAALVAENSAALLANQELLTALDFAQAKARLARKQKASAPALNNEGRILLKKARHPLIESHKVVPIDFYLGYEFNTLVITGPNTGGKTVSLKTCGLFCLMGMAGLQIPAEPGSEISCFKQVLADIGDEQSIEQSLSTFSSHMVQIIEICELASPGTLVLTDELGAGTDPSEGAALAIAILDYLRMKGCHTVATTHYQELKGYALNTKGVSNACCEFDQETLRPTFRLLIGVPGVSNALAVSKRLGLQQEILEAAAALISDEGAQFEELVQAIERSHQEAERMREDIARLQKETENARNELEKERTALKQQKKDMLNEARAEAFAILQKAEATIEQELKGMREEGGAVRRGEEAKKKILDLAGGLAEEIGKEKLAADIERPLTPEDIVQGESYEDVLSGFVGQAAEAPDDRGQVLLRSGLISLRVDVSGLRKAKPKVEEKTRKRSGKRKHQSATMGSVMNAKSEIKLLGKTVDEAFRELEPFLDDACLAGLSSVRIVHGKGTGALRRAIRQKLDGDRRIKDYQDAPFGQGDAGVTVAKLR